MIDGRNFFDQPVINDERTNGNIRKITNGQGDDHTTVYLQYYLYLKNYKMVAIDLSKQRASDN